MFRHVVMLQWRADAPADTSAVVAEALRGLPGAIAEIRSYSVGIDARVNEGNHDVVVVADFDEVEGYLVYRDHPAHVAVIDEFIKPVLAGRAAVQHRLA